MPCPFHVEFIGWPHWMYWGTVSLKWKSARLRFRILIQKCRFQTKPGHWFYSLMQTTLQIGKVGGLGFKWWQLFFLPVVLASNFKNTIHTHTASKQSPKRPQSSANDVEGVEYRPVWILTSHDSSRVTALELQLSSIALCVITVELTDLYCSVYVLQVPY